jgi:hypothetical protein
MGDIKSLGLEKSINSEWKVRKRKVRRIIDNEQYARLDIRKAELRQALKDSNKNVYTPNEKYSKLLQKRDAVNAKLNSATLGDTKRRNLEKELLSVEKKIASTPEMIPMKLSEMQKEIREIEKTLEITPQKIEAEIDEEVPYQVTNHAIDVRIRLTLRIANRGMELWPPIEYEDVFRIEDSVIPPNLMAEDPDERKGDPLTLPNDSDAKKMALENLVEKKMYPDLIKNFENYGIRFYEIAMKMSTEESDPAFSSVEFLDSIEEYFKFLACYGQKDADDGDGLVEQVQQKMDSLVLSDWLLTGSDQ